MKVPPFLTSVRAVLAALASSLAISSAAAGTINVPADQATIQAAVDAALPGDTIMVAPGVYAEDLTLNQRVELVGSGSGSDPLSDTILRRGVSTDSKIGVVQIAASGLSDASPLLMKNLRVEPVGKAGLSVGRFTEGTGTSVDFVKLDNVKVVGTNTNPSTEQERGLYVDLTSTLEHLKVTGCGFDNLTYGWYFQKQVSADVSNVRYVEVTGSTFNNNNHKGVYAEKLSDATFTGCLFHSNGYDASVLPTYFNSWCAGVDMNLKAGTYVNHSFINCTITDNATGGSKEGVGITFKGRDDGGYAAFPASLTSVLLDGCTITGNERGVRFGEPGKNSANPFNVTITDCDIHSNLKTYSGTDGSAYGDIVNMTAGTLLGLPPGGVLTTVIPGGSIQSAVNAAADGDIIQVAADTYTEAINLNRAVTIKGAKFGIAAGANPGVRGTEETVINGGFIVSSPGAVIDGVTIQNGRFSGSVKVGIAVTASSVTVRNTIIENVLSPAQSDGLSTQPGNNSLTLTNSTIRNNWRGIYLNPGSGHTLSGNLIDANNGVGVGIGSDGQSNLSLTGNTISNHTVEGWGASAVGANVVASGNSFLTNGVSIAHYGGAAINANANWWGTATPIFASLVSGAVTTQTWYADASLATLDSSLPIENVSENKFYETIQAAVAAANEGDTIKVAAGTYTGSVSITKSLTLLGANAGVHPAVGTHSTETVGIRGPETILAYGNGPGAISVSADNITLDGLKITSTGTRILDTYANADNFTLRNCIWQNTSGYAQQGTIQFGGGSHLNFTLEFNLFENGETALLYTGGNFDGLLIQYNKLNCEGDAVFWTAEPLDGGVIKGNEIDGTIGGFSGVGYNTFNIGQAGDLSIEDNWVHDVNYTAFQVGIIGGEIIDNTFEDTYAYDSDYGGYDIYLWGGAWGTALSRDVLISGNTFRYNNDPAGPVRAIRIAGPANPGDPAIDASTIHIHENSFIDGGAYTGAVAIRHQGDQSTTADATHNYWGTSTPDPVTLFSGPVAYLPYYIDYVGGTLHYPVRNLSTGFGAITLQEVLATAAAGNSIAIDPGTYVEAGQIVIDKNLTITGAGAATTILKPNHTTSGGSYAPENGWIAVSAGATLNLSGVTLDGTNLSGIPQTIKMAIISRGSVVVENCAIRNIASAQYYGWGICILANTDNVVRNCTFSGIQRIGVHVRGAVATATPSALVTGCAFTGKGNGDWVEYGVEFGGGGSGTVSYSTFSGFTGVASTDGSTSAGILATDYYGNGTHALIDHCDISASTTGIVVGYADADLTSLTATNNRITACGAGLSGTSSAIITATPNYWGADSGPSGVGPGSGTSITGPATFSPWWADAALTILCYGFAGDTVISDSQSVGNLYVGAGQTVTVTATGSLAVSGLELAPGATLVVNGGELDLGNGTVIAGSFTIFNSFGSWDINGDTMFTVGQSLALVSDIHVAAGKTVNVTGGGELILDGCVMDSQTPGSKYNFTADTDGLLTIARCVVTDANIDINTTLPGNRRSRVYDNRFVASDIEAAAAALVYHNLLDAATQAAANSDASTAFADVDGWGNVTDPAALLNQFTLGFEAPAATGRTLNSAGNLFVQPSDAVVMRMDVAALGSNTITGAEALLGYNSSMLSLLTTSDAVTPAGGWTVQMDNDSIVGSLGMVDSALGLDWTSGNPDGIGATTPVAIARVNFTAGTPGVTLGFFRVQTKNEYNPVTGLLLWDTRLTKSLAGVPSYLTPFTANTGELVIDNQAPTIAAATVNGTQAQANSASPVDVLDPSPAAPPAFTYRNGQPLVLTFTATDAGLAGLETGASDDPLELLSPAEVTDDLSISATDGSTTLDTYTVTAAKASGVVTYTVNLAVPVTATNGTYEVTATVRDRSGNVSALAPLGSFKLANEVLASVQLQGFGAATREVTFTATGGTQKSWTKTVNFTPAALGGIGSVPLEDVPAGTTHISAKTAWNLRSKLPADFSGTGGVAVVNLTGTDMLPGGDLNGDNVVNLLDYSLLRYHWGSTTNAVADIDGNAVIFTGDYNLLKANFYTLGDAP